MGKLTLEGIASGIKCEMATQYSFLARTELEWESHWKQFFSRRKLLDSGLIYDFSKLSIIGVCYGQSSTDALVRILHVDESRNQLEIDVAYWIGSNKRVCQPYHFARIPKTAKDASFSYRKVARTALGPFPGPFK